jgi:hypothetical protein
VPAPGRGLEPAPVEKVGPKIKLRALTKLSLKNGLGIPGQPREAEAVLARAVGDAPVGGKSIAFSLEGKSGTSVPGGAIALGAGVTDASGVAKVSFVIPELAQGAYRLTASFAGDEETGAAKAEANFGVVKGQTNFEMGQLVWSTYKNEPGPKTGSVAIVLRRTVDSASLKKRFWITVNGQRWQVGSPNGMSAIVTIPLPSAANTWNVKAEFEGDDANLATSAQRTYAKPN